MTASDAEIHLVGTVVNANSHVCAFFNNKEEEHRTLLPFIVEGLAQGDKIVRIVPEIERDEIKHRLRDEGIDVDGAEKRGQLEVLVWPKIALRDGAFDERNALELINDALAAAQRQGYARVRLFGDWALQDQIYMEDFIALEALINTVLTKHQGLIVCAYDLSRLNGYAVLAAMRTHRIAIIGGALQQNPFYVPPEQIMEELHQRGKHGPIGERTASY
jgi:hypothetical protein